ncbi:uncharacterized protein E5676_scaffold775G00070 [Cucumis melo var. makuwa]|uniref:Uncharacterized protein n=1 Tax=Cucumis melo var. makuwa TaxID=1194695 RepID=A0A5D3BR69_CUCMM|nr:uncharacterized protein E6C27_scaffold744G001010 [Cucumis melo var. makuwa]TYK01685.1 uncharacterized protein E5676_scaffold775G00070 [Cucumis melo var. makuwa]
MLCITNNEVGIKEEVEIESNGNEIMELKTMELGDDEEISFRSLHGCRRMELVLTEVTIKADFIATNLGQLDVILGILWLCWTGFMGDTLVIEIAPIYDGK